MAQDRAVRGWAPRWWLILLIGFALWVVATVVTGFTHDIIMVPTVILVGSFLVPVTAVVWYLDHDVSPVLRPRRIVDAFVIGGVVGVIAASLIEFLLLPPSAGALALFGVGLIEELTKLVVLIAVAWHLPIYTRRDGIVLGATVGFGFAALESSGYALLALVEFIGKSGALDFGTLVITELSRALLAPFGHGLWTGILGGVLFAAASRHGRYRITLGILGAYLGVSFLHGAFDTIHNLLGYLLVSLIGLAWWLFQWRKSRTEAAPAPVEVSGV